MTALESCHARALNRTLVDEFFDILEDVCTTYDVKSQNIYNMDEKGIQLGIGKRTFVLVNRDQKIVHQVEDRNRELMTVLETVCADRSALAPMVIFKGKTRNLQWGRQNPCDASIGFSENGWTDMELGSQFLAHHFEPLTRAKLESDDEWRMIILDGHNLHCTYCFCLFAEKHRILPICLPPHTTHRLQPCDVGVFGPLASAWKKEVTLTSQHYVRITKENLLLHYHSARQKAFTNTIISGAFLKTGIWPRDRSIIEESAFAPALNMTTQAALPLSISRPALGGDTAEAGPSQCTPSGDPYQTVPPTLPYTSSQSAYRRAYEDLHMFAKAAKKQMEGDYAAKKLMEAENEPAVVEKVERAAERAQRKAEAEAEKARKKAEANAERTRKKVEMEAEKARKKVEMEAEKARKKAEMEVEKARKKVEADEARMQRDSEEAVCAEGAGDHVSKASKPRPRRRVLAK
ncbi:hypothetical protein EW146_g9398 [Bondarzewia mesenterica]|uniref:DDE-1 domain-containing protein n=1 Tax=Bondarzewia mesenterica TaxID=1095465 RepID=A0A4S4L8K4_9AGAM|nr:hypothetical protein EW146_g9398 [Bondarzewia mesenterica]